jgi:predicted O-methyltransferase YrrM
MENNILEKKYPCIFYSHIRYCGQQFIKFLFKVLRRKRIRPWMDEQEINLVEYILKHFKPNRCLEWGAGFSTLHFSKRFGNKNAEWISIEHDANWADKIGEMMPRNNVHIYKIPPERVPWSDSNGDGSYSDLESYINFPKKLGKFDFILVDGRARVACLMQAVELLNSGGIVVLHDAERPYYHEGFRFFKYHVLLENKYTNRSIWVGTKDIAIGTFMDVQKIQMLWRINNLINFLPKKIIGFIKNQKKTHNSETAHVSRKI